MKVSVHNIKQDMALTFLSRDIIDKLESMGINTAIKALDYIKGIIHKCDTAEDVGTIEYWQQKVEFSKDYSTPIDVRLNDLYMSLNLASTKIKDFESNVEVRRRFLTMIAAKVDERLTVTPEYMKNNPQINTVKLFMEQLEKYKQLARRDPKDSYGSKKSTVTKNITPSINTSSSSSETRRLEAMICRLTSEVQDLKRAREDEASSKASVPEPKSPQAKEYTICSAKMRDEAYDGYTVQLKQPDGEYTAVKGVLDSGAQTNCAVAEDFARYCSEERALTNKVVLVPWQSGLRIEASSLGILRGVKVNYRDKKGKTQEYVFKSPVKVFLVPREQMAMQLCSELLIGTNTLKREGIHPLNSLRDKDRDEERRSRSRSSRRRKKSRSRTRSRSRSRDRRDRSRSRSRSRNGRKDRRGGKRNRDSRKKKSRSPKRRR